MSSDSCVTMDLHSMNVWSHRDNVWGTSIRRHTFLNFPLVKMCCQFYAPANLLPEKKSPYLHPMRVNCAQRANCAQRVNGAQRVSGAHRVNCAQRVSGAQKVNCAQRVNSAQRVNGAERVSGAQSPSALKKLMAKIECITIDSRLWCDVT